MASILLKNAVVVTMNADREVHEKASVLIRDSRIAAIGDAAEASDSADEMLD
jgi:predicted amidohydrolase YtcJ